MITWSLEVPGVKSEVLKDAQGSGVPAVRKWRPRRGRRARLRFRAGALTW